MSLCRAEAIPECAVCLQTCVHPARLPCSHIFCFLCLKGLVTQSRRCAMCRQDIPLDYLDHPQLLEIPTPAEKEAFEDGYQWFYEGRSGWWQYDERTSRELEAAYKSGQRTCELLIVGQLYIADFDAMLQLRRNDLSRRRRIKRDLASIPKKGIAGLRLEGAPSSGDEPSPPSPSGEPGTSRLESDENWSETNTEPSSNTWQSDREGADLVLRDSQLHRVAEAEDDSDENHSATESDENSPRRQDLNDDTNVDVHDDDDSDSNQGDLEAQLQNLRLH
ncbi:E3 ubiquitin-protein ligase RNF146 isoform X2 [Thrips palmi]|uniref:E3 ubiquitin-protein ligase n=1 Tax=Thrips palmi TaxID=161013 RepID=A0A6P8YVR0_THRPL|nr:E3 ubiquitin-protein ligase RNF146 isoform X2 [Thrips palmi]